MVNGYINSLYIDPNWPVFQIDPDEDDPNPHIDNQDEDYMSNGAWNV